jgi:hypothetical protein
MISKKSTNTSRLPAGRKLAAGPLKGRSKVAFILR